jgi:hypothetical protein
MVDRVVRKPEIFTVAPAGGEMLFSLIRIGDCAFIARFDEAKRPPRDVLT